MTDKFQLAFQGSPHECVEAFAAAARAFRERDRLTPIVALVGSHWLRRRLRDRLHGAAGFWGLRLLTFRDLADRLGEPALRRAGRRPVSPHFQRALAARLARERSGYFAPVRDYDGAAPALLAVFDDLEDAGWTRWPVAAPAAGKLADVAALFNDYRAALAARFFTPQDALHAAAEAAADFPAAFGADRLHVVGLYDVNPQQMRLLDALAAHLDVCFYAPQAVEPTALAQRLGVAAPPPARPPAVKILSCPSEVEETKAVVRAAAALRREGVAYHEMAVLARQSPPYGDLFVEACGRAKIPCRVAGGRTPRDAASRRALQQLIALLDSPLGRTEVMAFLTAAPPAPSVANRAWENISRAAMVKRGDDWDRRLAAFAACPDDVRAPGPSGADERRRAARGLREAALSLRDGLAEISSATTFTAAARALAALARRFIKPDDRFDEALTGLADLGAADEAGLPFDAAYFRARAAEIVRAVKEDDPDGDALTLLDWQAARGLQFRVVFVPGCVEGLAPLPPRQDPVLLNEERAALAVAAHAPGALPTTADRAKEELRLFDFVCGAARERLVFSFPRADPASGRPRLPSHLLLALASRLAGRMLTYDELPGAAPLVEVLPAGRFAPASFAAALDDDERDLNAMTALAGVDPLAPIHYLLGARPASFGRVWRRQQNRWACDDLTAHDGWSTAAGAGALIRERVGGRPSWSVRDLESYALCPRRFCFERLLGLAGPDDPEAVVALPRDQRGSLIHRALERAIDQPTRDAAALVAELYEAQAAANRTGGGLLDEVERERLIGWTRAMREFALAQSAGRPARPEQKVNMAFVLADGSNIEIRGRLDRVEGGAATRIVDFKTGRARSPFRNRALDDDSFNAGATLQLPLYLLLWAAAHPADRDALQAAYWHLKNAKGAVEPAAVVFGPDFLPAHELKLRAVVAAIVEDLRDGHFAPRPDLAADPDNEYCPYCPFTVVCDARGRARAAVKMRAAPPYRWLDIVGRFDDAEP